MKLWRTLCVLAGSIGSLSANHPPLEPLGGFEPPAPAAQQGLWVDLDGDGLTELVQVKSGGRRVQLVGREFGSFEFTLVAEALDLMAYDWIPGGALELVVATRRGIVVHALDGRILEARVAELEDAGLAQYSVWRGPGQESGGPSSVLLVTRATKGGRARVHLLCPGHAGLFVGSLPIAAGALVGSELGGETFGVRLRGKLRVEPIGAESVSDAEIALRLPAMAR